MDPPPAVPFSPCVSPKSACTPPSSTTSPVSYRSRRTPPSTSRLALAARSKGDNRTARRLSFSVGASSDTGGAGGFTFSPLSLATAPGKSLANAEKAVPSMDLSQIKDSLEAAATAPPQQSPRRIAGLRPRSTRRPPPSRRTPRCSIQDLPDELLVKIFLKLDEQQGFRPLHRHSSTGPEWYSPPLRIALVCKRWLPIARQLFYRALKIHHLKRISSLHETFTTTDLSLAVRHLSINLPYSSLEKLSLAPSLPPSSAGIVSTAHEPDSDLDALNESNRDKKKKPRPPITAQDQLRTVFQSCSQLLSLEISGVAPPILFSSSSVASASLHHLHQLRLSTISSLKLRGGPDSQVLDSITLRQALLALTGLRALSIKGYVSNAASPLEFAPTSTAKGSPARPLPSRARALLKLNSIVIVESAMDPADLETLLKQVQHGTIERLVVTDHYHATQSAERTRQGQYGGTTIEGLSQGQVGQLVCASLRTLRVTLHNFPLARDAVSSAAARYTPVASPPRSLPRQIGTDPVDPPYILDRFISRLAVLETLDVGGSLVTSNLLVPTATNSSPSHRSCSAPPAVESCLPATVKSLTIRACPALTPRVVSNFLASLVPPPRHHHRLALPRGPSGLTAPSSQLKTLEVFGGSESGWRNPIESWQVQKACWDARVEWSGGGAWLAPAAASSSLGGGSGGGTGGWRQESTASQSVW
ncbi:hypothetical protein JCM11491_000726 [Sporobolomyces phaffii]